jgi:hypothetical protein
MTRMAAALPAFVALAMCATFPQSAVAESVSTHVEGRGLDIFPAELKLAYSVSAHIRSRKHACRDGRRVKLYFRHGKKRSLEDIGRSGDHGAVALTGLARRRPDRLILRVQRKRIERRRLRFTCSSANLRLFPRAATVRFEFTPSTVPEDDFRAGALDLLLRTGATHDTRTTRIEFGFDDDFRFSTDVVPTCDPDELVGQIDMAEAMGRCGSAKVGAGTGEGTLGTAIFNGCVLAFNGTPSDDGLPAILLFIRADPSPPTIDCSNPDSNHNGHYTLLWQGSLADAPDGSGYGRVLTLRHLAAPVQINDLNLTLGNGDYVSARCSSPDALDGWQLRTQLRYLRPRSAQTMHSIQPCLAE